MSAYRRFGKRAFDLAVVITASPLVVPVLSVLALVVRTNLGSPVLFTQDRPGLHGRIFRLYKFRTMTNARDARGELLPDEQRLTRFGRFLRSTSLDELPELYNVVRGEMSLVGPRPLLVRYLERYSPEQARRHDTRPGITGLAQVRGRNNLPWADRFKLDVYYVDHASLWLDLQILVETVGKVLRRSDISEEGHATKSEFMGEP